MCKCQKMLIVNQNTGEQSERVRGPFEDKDSRTTPMAGGKNMLTAEGWCRPGLTTGYLRPLALDETSHPERKQIASYRQVDISAPEGCNRSRCPDLTLVSS